MNTFEHVRWHLLVMDGHDLHREALCLLLSRILPDAAVYEMPGEVNDRALDAGSFSLILLNLKPPYMSGFDRLRVMRRRLPRTPVILLSDMMSDKLVLLARACGASSFVHTSANSEHLLAAIRDVLAGKKVFPDRQITGKRTDFRLSPRQLEVMDLLCKGMTNKEIGARLRMSDNTVRTHMAAIFDLLGVRNRTEAAMLGRYL